MSYGYAPYLPDIPNRIYGPYTVRPADRPGNLFPIETAEPSRPDSAYPDIQMFRDRLSYVHNIPR